MTIAAQQSQRARRNSYREFVRTLHDQAKNMGGHRVPRHFWCPGPGAWLSAGQYARALKMIANADPAQEFKQSFGAWWSKTAQEIRRDEVIPAIHERINCRPFIQPA